MKLRLLREDTVGHQEPWPDDPPGVVYSQPVVYLHAYVESDDGAQKLALGRLFFSPEMWEAFGPVQLDVVLEGAMPNVLSVT